MALTSTFLVSLIVALTTDFSHAAVAGDWGYEAPNAAVNWTALGVCPYFTRQSPIDINRHASVFSAQLQSLDLSSYERSLDGKVKLTLKNNGRTVVLSLAYTSDDKYVISGSGFTEPYVLDSIHFHWGHKRDDKQVGSEHTVDGHHYALEAHFVHYRQSLGSVRAALADPSGLAVLGMFFVSMEVDCPHYKELLSNFGSIQYKDQTTNLPKISPLINLLPGNKADFYRYEGSLTTPNCNEAVLWTLFNSPVKISQAQIDSFYELFETSQGAGKGHHIVNNYRPVQPLNGRTVKRSMAAVSGTARSAAGSSAWLACFLLAVASSSFSMGSRTPL